MTAKVPPGFLETDRFTAGDFIRRIRWSPDGKGLAVCDGTEAIYTRDAATWRTRYGAWGIVHDLSWDPKGNKLVVASGLFVQLIDLTHNAIVWTKSASVDCVSWAPDGSLIATGSRGGGISFWDPQTGNLVQGVSDHQAGSLEIAWSDDSRFLATSVGSTIKIWRVKQSRHHTVEPSVEFKGHALAVTDLAWSPDGSRLASVSEDMTLKVWDTIEETLLVSIEKHAGETRGIDFSPDGTILASHSTDNTVRFWNPVDYSPLASVELERADAQRSSRIEFNPSGHSFAISRGRRVAVWSFDPTLLASAPAEPTVRYTTAKLVLVGDAGVGKTGLGWRLAHNEFKEHASTHGQQFWVIHQLDETRDDGAICEAVLWDLAGQPDYRIVHSIFLDQIQVALLVFDPTDRRAPLSGVDYWLHQLVNQSEDVGDTRSILVGARIDRGVSTLTARELTRYCEQNQIAGGYLGTSARSGEGIEDLVVRLKELTAWSSLSPTITTRVFKQIKDYVLDLKARDDRDSVLLNPEQLRGKLEGEYGATFSLQSLRTAVRHVANHGYVTLLRNSRDEDFVLLAPDLLANLASSIVLEARRNLLGLGVVEQEKLFSNEYRLPELNGRTSDEVNVLLDCVILIFMKKNLCFRERHKDDKLLVFPSLINEKRPLFEEKEIIEDVSYRIRGSVENVYASLVVLLGYTSIFTRTDQWQDQAQFEMNEGEVCGFRQSGQSESETEITLYYGPGAFEGVRTTFRGLVERFLTRQNLQVERFFPIVCTRCSCRLDRSIVTSRLAKGRWFSFCPDCGERLALASPDELVNSPPANDSVVTKEQGVADGRSAFEVALVRINALLRDAPHGAPQSCFISYSWGHRFQEKWVLQLAKDLTSAGIDVLFDRWHSPPGEELDSYIDKILATQFVIVVGTEALLNKYKTQASDPIVAAELKLINIRIREPSLYRGTVIPILLTGDKKKSFTPQLQTLVHIDFRKNEEYFISAIHLIWRIWGLPFDSPLLEEITKSFDENS